MSLRISTDIGGTFTDLVIIDEKGVMNIYKAPTTPHRHTKGIIGAIEVAASERKQSVTDLLRDCTKKILSGF